VLADPLPEQAATAISAAAARPTAAARCATIDADGKQPLAADG